MFTKLLEKIERKINCRIHVVQVCLKLAGACNETVYIPVRKHWSGHQSQWIEQNTIHFIEKYIFLLILTEDDRGRQPGEQLDTAWCYTGLQI